MPSKHPRSARKRRAKRELFAGAEYARCAHCDVLLAFDEATLDHVKPKSLGGTDRRSNLRLSCLPCNQRRSNRIGFRAFHRQMRAEPPRSGALMV